MGVTTTAIIWACVAKIEKRFRLRASWSLLEVKEIQAPVGGVVKAVYVSGGKSTAGARLLSLDPTTGIAELASLQKIRTALIQENQIYRAQMSPQAKDRGKHTRNDCCRRYFL